MIKDWEIISMVELSDWQWGIGAGVLIALLMIGGFINRKQEDPDAIKQNDDSSLLTAGNSELDERAEQTELNKLRQQLQARDSELKDAQEEAELILLQLHQVQEELEHYFLESRQQVSSQALTSAQLDQLQRIKLRLIHQFKVSPAQDNPAFKHIVRRQQNALRRFQRLHQKH